MTSARDWEGRTGESWAAEWRRTDRSWNGLTDELLRHTRDFSFETVLDIGCGAGELSLAIARGRPGATVIGLDISAPLIAAARDRGRNLANVAFETGDASSWTPPTRRSAPAPRRRWNMCSGSWGSNSCMCPGMRGMVSCAMRR